MGRRSWNCDYYSVYTHNDHIDILLPCARTQNISRGSSDDCADNAENVVVPCIVLYWVVSMPPGRHLAAHGRVHTNKIVTVLL